MTSDSTSSLDTSRIDGCGSCVFSSSFAFEEATLLIPSKAGGCSRGNLLGVAVGVLDVVDVDLLVLFWFLYNDFTGVFVLSNDEDDVVAYKVLI